MKRLDRWRYRPWSRRKAQIHAFEKKRLTLALALTPKEDTAYMLLDAAPVGLELEPMAGAGST